ncbi:MAG: HAD-IA family hydrolase [Gammaproteobacteria bacterium]|nr:HAD-IA family hydrolase [Gammaproteobacteria bacterium]MCP4476253.1 HAD-IA family hydrolase [Gammaproteobacteria bacterium]
MHYKLIIFDWDGTLYDSADYIVQQTRRSAQEVNVPIPSDSAIRKVVGLSFDAAINHLFGHLSRPEVEKFVTCYRGHLDDPNEQLPALFDEARAVLQTLKKEGYYIAVATAKMRQPFQRDLVAFGLTDFFDATRCGDEARSKPHPQMLEEILMEIDVAASDAIMIGDTEYDIGMANQAGIDSVAATYGFHAKELLLSRAPTHLIDHISELPSILVPLTETVDV